MTNNLSKYNEKCTICKIPVPNPTKILKIKPKIINNQNQNQNSPTQNPLTYTTFKTLTHLCTHCMTKTKNSYENILDLLNIHSLTLSELNFTYFLCNNNIYIHKREWRHYVKHTLNAKIRKEKLFKKLAEEKLQYQKNGICDAYILHGQITLDDVVNTLHQKQIEYNKRLQKLIKILDKNNLVYDQNIPAYQRYLNHHKHECQVKHHSDFQVDQNIYDVIQEAELERILMQETDYVNLLKKKDINEARDISLMRCNVNKKIIKKTIQNKITLRFD